MPPPRVLFHVTGFGPFGGGEELVEALPTAVASGQCPLPAGCALGAAAVLTTAAHTAAAQLAALPLPRSRRHPSPPRAAAAAAVAAASALAASPQAEAAVAPVVCVLHLGVHSTSRCFRLERCAWNEARFRCADEAGWAPQGEAVLCCDVPGHCRRTRLPVDALVAALRAEGHDCVASDDPGRFVCNYTYYVSLARADGAAEESSSSSDALAALPHDAAHADEHSDDAPAGVDTPPAWHALFLHVPPASVVPVTQQMRVLAALMAAIALHLAPPSAAADEHAV